MNIIYYGRGALGTAIGDACGEAMSASTLDGWAQFTDHPTHPLDGWETAAIKDPDFKKTVAIYAGRESMYEEMLNFCSERSIPLIIASTNVDMWPGLRFPTMHAPNLNPLIVAMLKGLEQFFKPFEVLEPEICVQGIESHQASKGDKMSGTLTAMGKIVGTKNLSTIRDPAIQTMLGIRNLERHGYHWLTISGFNSEVEITSKIEGIHSYGLGALFFAKRFQERRESPTGLENRMYTVTEYI